MNIALILKAFPILTEVLSDVQDIKAKFEAAHADGTVSSEEWQSLAKAALGHVETLVAEVVPLLVAP